MQIQCCEQNIVKSVSSCFSKKNIIDSFLITGKEYNKDYVFLVYHSIVQ